MIALFLAASGGLLFTVITTPFLIQWLRKNSVGQQIRDDGPVEHPHANKVGTPTMGGIALVAGVVIGYAFAHIRQGDFKFSRSGLLLMGLVLGCMAIGFLDDYLGIKNSRNLGLRKRGKLFGQLSVAFVYAFLAVHWADTSTHLSFTRELDFDLGTWGWIAMAVAIIMATTNAANLTDGLDGLLSGTSILVFGVYAIIAFWLFRHFGEFVSPTGMSVYPYTVEPAHALDLSAIAAAFVGACTGFLWWNAAPARIFMGDTGSMAIGGGMAGLALMTNTQLLLPIIAGLCLVETLSVIAQVISFRGFGKRILRMSPIHHHFELSGWPETTVTVRFWIFAGMCSALGLGLFYADFLSIPSVTN